jgi:hypothetical protein
MIEYISVHTNSIMVKKEMPRHAIAKSMVNTKYRLYEKPVEACMITSCHQHGTKRAWTRTRDGVSDFWARYHSTRCPALDRGGAVSGLFAELARILLMQARRE